MIQKGRGMRVGSLPSSPRHDNAESKKQAQKSVRSLHRRVPAGAEPQHPRVQAGDAPKPLRCWCKVPTEAAVGKDCPSGRAQPQQGCKAARGQTHSLSEGSRQAAKSAGAGGTW